MLSPMGESGTGSTQGDSGRIWAPGVDLDDGRNITVSVAYPSVRRDSAEVTYTIPGRGTGVHVLAYIDISISNKDAMDDLSAALLQAEEIRYSAYSTTGFGRVVDHDTGTTAQTFICDSAAHETTGQFNDEDPFASGKKLQHELNGDLKRPGIGQPNELAALDSMLSELDKIPAGKTPVIFWALAPDASIRASGTDIAAIQEKLEEVRDKLATKGGELVTWQRDGVASSFLAGEHTHTNAVQAASFREAVTKDLERIVSDGVDGFRATLSIPSSVTLATGIRQNSVRVRRAPVDSGRSIYEGFTTFVSGRSVEISIPRFHNNINDTEISFTVDLSTDANICQYVDGFSVSGNYGLGIFDEAVRTYPAFPGFDLDRLPRTVYFKAERSSGADRTMSYQGLPGESILAPSGAKWSNGNEFSGWADAVYPDAVLRAGEELRIPDTDATMVALWGHVEMGLYLGNVTPGPKPGNQMYPGPSAETKKEDWSTALARLRSVFLDDIGVNIQDAVVSVVTEDKAVVSSGTPFDVVTVSGGIDGGKPNGVYMGLDEVNPVVVYVTGSSGNYQLHIAGPEGVTAPYSIDGLFEATYYYRYASSSKPNTSKMTSIDISKMDTRCVTNMHDLFYGNWKLTSITFGEFDTANVKTMRYMFGGCEALTSINGLASFDTGNVTDMGHMFEYCERLSALDISRFNTSNVRRMDYMFNCCKAFGSLDASNFDTSKVVDMCSMFERCSELMSLDVSGFDTSKVTNMSSMFEGCSKLVSLDVSGFDTSSVTDMSSMFEGCRTLTSLDVSSFDTSKVVYMDDMFRQDFYFDPSSGSRLQSIVFGSKFDTSRVRNMNGMFAECYVLSSVDLSGFDTSNVTDMSEMFDGCMTLTSLDLSSFSTGNVKDMYWMFFNCTSLTSIGFGDNFDTSNVKTMDKMFANCPRLSALDLGLRFDTSSVTDFRCMFYNCTDLQTLDLGDKFYLDGKIYDETRRSIFTTYDDDYAHGMFESCAKLANVDGLKWKEAADVSTALLTKMFYGCSSLVSVSLPGAVTGTRFPNLSSTFQMFYGCTSLSSVDLRGWILPNLSSVENMFYNAGNGKQLTIHMEWNGFSGSDISATAMVYGPSGVTLYIGDYDVNGGSDYILKKKMIESVKGTMGSRLIVYKSDGATVNLNALAILGPAVLLSTERQGAALPSDDKIDYSQKIPTYADPTSVGTKVSYVVRTNYVGDGHGRSGVVDVRYPLPSGVGLDASVEASDLIQVGALVLADGTSLSGDDYVVSGKAFRVTGDVDSGYILEGSLINIPAGAYLDVTVRCVLEKLDDSTKEVSGNVETWYWTGTAYSASNSGAAASNPIRLWFTYETSPVAPDQGKASVSYKYVGDIPVGVDVPEAGLYAAGASVLAPKPAAVAGYRFDGWYKNNAGQALSSYVISSSDVGSSADIVFYGKWSIDEATGMHSLSYRYVGDEIPEGVDTLLTAKLKPGATCSILEPAGIYGYEFDGWSTVKVDGVVDTTLPKSGMLDTSALGVGREIIYEGSWSPQYATIRFVLDGSSDGAPADMQIRLAGATEVLPGGDCNVVMGWFTSPDGTGTAYGVGSPASVFTGKGNLLSEPGDVLVLYGMSGSPTPLPKTGGMGMDLFFQIGCAVCAISFVGLALLGASRKRKRH